MIGLELPITRLRWVSTLGGQLNTGWDNIRIVGYEAAIPEPASWALMIAGFGLVGGALRRRRGFASALA